MTDKKSYFDDLVERLRKHETYAGDYMLIGEEDKTIRETVDALERVVRERDEARKVIERYERGLNTIATTFYKDDQHQDYAKHVLDIRNLEPRL